MIEEVVNSILEAEDVAAKKIADAKQKASEIVARAETEADDFKKQSAAQNKAYFAETSKKIETEATDIAKKELAALNSATDKEMATYGKNVDKAVKIILESLK